MNRITKLAIKALVAVAIACAAPRVSPATAIGSADVEAAVTTGNFVGYLSQVTTWLNAKLPSPASDAAMKELLKHPDFALALDQQVIISKTGPDQLAAFAKADPENKALLAWMLSHTDVMDLYLEGSVPIGLGARDQNAYRLSTNTLEIWKKIIHADPESKTGLYLRMAIATAIHPPGSSERGAGQSPVAIDPVERYQHFKTWQKNKELFPSFDTLTVWEMEKVLSCNATDHDLAWAREAINTWRPDLRVNEQVVNSTSEVWRRNSPHPYVDYSAVLSGGGKCGPRSSWSVFVCQAFGIPAIGVGQPRHACVAYKAFDANLEPQPGHVWKVGYGRGWQFSHLEGMFGPEFIAGVEDRARPDFAQIEHLRWYAASLTAADKSAAVMEVVHQIQKSVPPAKINLAASVHAEEADAELPGAKAGVSTTATKAGPIKLTAGETKFDAAACSQMAGVRILNCYTGGKQVNFDKSTDKDWVEYTLDVPASGLYTIQLTTAAANEEQVFDVTAGSHASVTIKVPYTTGLWGQTEAVSLSLDKGPQTLKIAAPSQRAVAVRSITLKANGN